MTPEGDHLYRVDPASETAVTVAVGPGNGTISPEAWRSLDVHRAKQERIRKRALLKITRQSQYEARYARRAKYPHGHRSYKTGQRRRDASRLLSRSVPQDQRFSFPAGAGIGKVRFTHFQEMLSMMQKFLHIQIFTTEGKKLLQRKVDRNKIKRPHIGAQETKRRARQLHRFHHAA